MSANELNARLAAASAKVAAARRALDSGQAVALDDLAEKVNSACHDLAELPGAEAKAFQSQLLALFDDINGLAEALQRERDSLKQSLGDLSTRQRASSAYRETTRKGG